MRRRLEAAPRSGCLGRRQGTYMAAEETGRYARDLFLIATNPEAAATLWEFLSPSDRSALQAAHWWLHSDLRWYLFNREAVFDESEDEAPVPARAG